MRRRCEMRSMKLDLIAERFSAILCTISAICEFVQRPRHEHWHRSMPIYPIAMSGGQFILINSKISIQMVFDLWSGRGSEERKWRRKYARNEINKIQIQSDSICIRCKRCTFHILRSTIWIVLKHHTRSTHTHTHTK